jgi:DNA ligase-1
MREFGEKSVAAGFEGIMIKNLAAPYECKRTSSWMKWKPTITVDLEVVDIEEGTGRNIGRLGALVCSGEDNGRIIKVNVGSGFTDDNRTEFWNSHVTSNNIIGNIIEVEADVITQNQDGSYSLRFPRFIRFRGFEQGEKL